MVTDINWLKRMLSHNVRMPMSVITGYGELLRQGLLSAEEQKTVIENICDNINYMNDVLKVVLEDDAEQNGTLEAVDVAKLLYRSVEYVSEVAKKVPVRIDVRTEKPSMLIRAEYIPVLRVFYQLFENAIKYLDGGDTITINAYYAGKDHVLIVFKDNGKGIPEKDVKRIFEKGYRGGNSKGKYGSGYGLYDVKQVVERYGGTVEISSREHTGFSVYLMFPVYQEMKGKEVKADGADIAGRR